MEYFESNTEIITNLVKDNKTHKQISDLFKQTFPHVTRGFSERNLRLFCSKQGIRRRSETEVDAIIQECVSEVSSRLLYNVLYRFDSAFKLILDNRLNFRWDPLMDVKC